MPTAMRIGLSALATLALLYFGPQLLHYPLVLLTESLFAAIPVDSYTLSVTLASLLAGVVLALLAANRRLVTVAVVTLGLTLLYGLNFASNLCSAEETQRIHAEMEAMPMYNLGQPWAEQPVTPHEVSTLSYACILPEERSDNVLTIAGDFLFRLVVILVGTLLIPRRRAMKALIAS